MHLFLIRHALAEDRQQGQDDASRELTDTGVRKLSQIVEGLRTLDITFGRVLTSPWLRATATARLLAPISQGAPIATELLTRPPEAALLALIAVRKDDTAIVGHEPWLGELVAWLAFGDPRHGDALQLKKGGVVWLEGSAVPGGMRLRAVLPPKVLRAVRRSGR